MSTNGSSQACAACKYQRRKCTPDCTLAPYFPPDHHRQFLNVHRLFGVSNILKIIRNLEPSKKEEAMRTIIIQADIRAADPVSGCYRIIHDLQSQIERDKAELQLVQHQLAICRAHAQAQQAHHLHHQDPIIASYINPLEPISILSPTPSLLPSPSPSLLQHHLHHHQPQEFLAQDQDINQWIMQEIPNPNPNPNPNLNPNKVNDLEASSSSSPILHVNKEPFMNECDDIKPLLGIFDDREQALPIDHKDSIQTSDEAVLKEEEAGSVVLKVENNPVEQVREHDLKGAASFFTLTNCNSEGKS